MNGSKESSVETLPEILKPKPSLVEASGKKSARSAASRMEDSGLDLRESLSGGYSTRVDMNCSSRSLISNGGAGVSPPGIAFAPSPPPGGPILRNGGTSPSPRGQAQFRRSLEYVRLSRGELDRREQATSSLRAENLKLQTRIRELEQGAANHAVLHTTYTKLAQSLGCSIDGVAAESVREMLTGKVHQLTQENRQTSQQMSSCKGELERCKGELAAANMKSTHLETQVGRLRSSLAAKESEAKQTKTELESLQQNSARTGAMMQSLRQQLTEAEQKQTSNSSRSDDLTQLQAEVGRLKNDIKKREDNICELEMKLQAKQAEQDSVQERLTNADLMYAELCSQLAAALQYEDNDSVDTDFLISQVHSVTQENDDLKLRIETMAKTINTAELDSKASRETILRLVSETKKQEKSTGQLVELKQTKERLETSLKSLEKERGDLYQRVAASQETLAAQNKELQAKEQRISELSQTVHSMRLASNEQKSLTESVQLKYEEMCESLASVLESQTKDSVALMQKVQQLKATTSSQADRLAQTLSNIRDLESACERRQRKLAHAEEELAQERSKVQQLEAELATSDIVKEGLGSELDKHKAFCKRLGKAVHLDSGVAEMLSGDFAHDAVLLKVEQLMKQETQALGEKQTAVYSLQRKLKSSRQALESKELHLGLVQKKVVALEDRLQSYSQREAEWENTTNKARKIERQLEMLQERATQQRNTITKLKTETSEAETLKGRCSELEDRLARQTAQIEELSQSRVHQATQLAEARQKVLASRTKDREEMEKLEGELRTAKSNLRQAQEKAKELDTFRTAVHRLLTGGGDKDAPCLSDFDLVAKLEATIAAQRKNKEERRCLEASLKQLELGFKASYEDALTLVASTNDT